jgi:protein-disulfide isomerase
MRKIAAVLALGSIGGALLGATGSPSQGPAPAKPPPATPAGPTEKALEAYLLKYLSFDPDSRVTVARTTEKTVPGYRAYKFKRTGRYSKLDLDKVVFLSEDGKWFFAGDTLPNVDPKTVRTSEDLNWLSTYLTDLFHSSAHATLAPERDRGGLKGVLIATETGYGRVRLPGYTTPDGRVFLQGTLFDFSEDPRAERRRMIDLSGGPVQGPSDARVNVVEYADMECGYCKFRGQQMDRLLEANSGIVSIRRYYKFFPLWLAHVWAMKAASAGQCIFRFVGSAPMFRFKQQVYAAQESMTVGGIDQLAVSTAQGEGVSMSDFLSCYLREESFGPVTKDMEEGYRLGVNSTPTYFVDGTEINWLEEKVMEDFLRGLFPKIKTIDYGPRK